MGVVAEGSAVAMSVGPIEGGSVASGFPMLEGRLSGTSWF